MKISAFLVIYNEEKHIERSLGSLKDVVDEIVVVHDGECTDRSLEIAKDFGAKIFVQEHRGMREFHQVFAINQCKYDWILQIDADEFLSPEMKKNLRNLIENKDIDAYS
ncbi:MAG TPA: glycosyltransferase, partial [Candidatus Dojkabacteria bacterium]|nr:glycosyltransferase [Candidatus Dojkabacteria bacterium]